MTARKYEKCIISKRKPGFIPEFFGPPAKNVETHDMAYLDDEVLPGSHYVETVWFLKGSEEIAVYPHVHDFDELIGFYGNNPKNPDDLGGEVEETLGDEKYIITKSCIIFIPKGLKHGPLIIRRVDRPFFHFATGNTGLYHGQKV
jgi:hypothetical protein